MSDQTKVVFSTAGKESVFRAAGEEESVKKELAKQQKAEIIRLASMNRSLVTWFEKNARKLPWREHPTPYQVWISEIMLQQTRVEAVKPYYMRFMETFPDVQALARAEEDVLMKHWEGLGYYSRARNLKAAAVKICSEYGGELPRSYEQLLKLPGIGAYTAGAVASLAYGIGVPAVDGNALRVVARVIGSREDIAREQTKKRFTALLQESMDREHAGAFNQGLFETGATVCIPKGEPRCRECPLAAACITRQKGLWESIPVKSGKKPRRIEQRTVFLITNGKQIALNRRPDRGLLASLYEFPNTEGHLCFSGVREAEEALSLQEGQIEAIESLGETKHIFSHVEWRMVGYRLHIRGKLPEMYICADICRLDEKYPIPSAFLAYKNALFR